MEDDIFFSIGEHNIGTTEIFTFCAILVIFIVLVCVIYFMFRKLKSDDDGSDFDNVIQIAKREEKKDKGTELADIDINFEENNSNRQSLG